MIRHYDLYFFTVCNMVMEKTGITREGSAVGLKMVYQFITEKKKEVDIVKEREKLVKRKVLQYMNTNNIFNEDIDLEKVGKVLEEKETIRTRRIWIKNPEPIGDNGEFIPRKKREKQEKQVSTREYVSMENTVNDMKTLLNI